MENKTIYNNLTMENLIKTEHFKSMNREQRKEIIENSSWFFQFHYYKQEEISSGIDKGVDISIYAKDEYNWKQMAEIREGLERNLNVSVYKNSNYHWTQMQEIRLGLLDNLDTSVYANPKIDYEEMKKIRLELLKEKTNEKQNAQ